MLLFMQIWRMQVTLSLRSCSVSHLLPAPNACCLLPNVTVLLLPPLANVSLLPANVSHHLPLADASLLHSPLFKVLPPLKLGIPICLWSNLSSPRRLMLCRQGLMRDSISPPLRRATFQPMQKKTVMTGKQCKSCICLLCQHF